MKPIFRVEIAVCGTAMVFKAAVSNAGEIGEDAYKRVRRRDQIFARVCIGECTHGYRTVWSGASHGCGAVNRGIPVGWRFVEKALAGRVTPEGFASAVLFSETVATGCKSFDVLMHPTIIMSVMYSVLAELSAPWHLGRGLKWPDHLTQPGSSWQMEPRN
ncbi:hypothetical protein G5I_04482 [Acromyrmex echinatior]|uniref:Uncharacterized protein n=1 Tax=Acromyrmex echinatior TaxID=103372 RepID=F4WFS3_ACREC|nr:hypothetical protein G5I_04482 [Acromyrmex echinatior]